MEPEKARGICDLCGRHGRNLRILIISDFIGWACDQCREQLNECTLRRYCGTGEETDPAE